MFTKKCQAKTAARHGFASEVLELDVILCQFTKTLQNIRDSPTLGRKNNTNPQTLMLIDLKSHAISEAAKLLLTQ
jgi:hypothetical protein